MPIQSQTIPLSVLDTQGSFSNIPFVFIYENAGNVKDFMSTDSLRKSFFLTMDQLPIFYGNLKSKGFGNVSIIVDKDNPNMPDYSESPSAFHFKDLKKQGFCWSSWPADVATAGAMSCPDKKSGKIKLINVHVVRLNGNSGVMVYFSIPHYVLDGVAHMEVMRRWCQIHQLVIAGKEEKVDELPDFSWDRPAITNGLAEKCSNCSLVDQATYQTFASRSILSDLFAWISPELRGKVLNYVVKKQNTSAHLFHISKSSFEALKEGLKAHLDNRLVDSLPYNDLVLALTTKTLTQSQKLAGYSKDNGNLPLSVIFEAREQLGINPSEYVGNILVPRIARPSLKILESPTTFETLATAINEYSSVVSNLTASVFARHLSVVSDDPSCFTRPIIQFARSKTATSFVYDIMPNMYEADFGHGKPAWVSPIEPFRSHAILLLTSKDPSDGIDVFLTAFPDVMDKVLKNEFWNKVAKLIY